MANSVAIAFMTRDRVEQTKRVAEKLIQPGNFDLWWFDGSENPESERLHATTRGVFKVFGNVRQGPDAAAVCALTKMLEHRPPGGSPYLYVGICENDILFTDDDWFAKTMALFAVDDGLRVGAVSARAYEDRVLIQCDGYAVMHNLGYGMIILSRTAAQIALNGLRTSGTWENRQVFNTLSGVNIGLYWAFRDSNHMICADWGLDRILAENGFASLALTPSPIEMIGQKIPLVEQGLKVADREVTELRGLTSFDRYRQNLDAASIDHLHVGQKFFTKDGTTTYFAHQLRKIGGSYAGDWKLDWSFGYGPFAYAAEEAGATIVVPVYGDCTFLVHGGEDGSECEVWQDEKKVFQPKLGRGQSIAHAQGIKVPQTRLGMIRLKATKPGLTFYALQTPEPQAHFSGPMFDYNQLP